MVKGSFKEKQKGAEHLLKAAWDVAIIIVAYEGDDWIPNCLESLKTSTQVNALVLLVDNKDNTDLKSGTMGSLTIHCFKTPQPMGFADANNFALMKVPSNVPNICFLNQDTISQKNWLEEALSCLKQNPEIGAVSPMLKNYQGTDWDHEFHNLLKSQPEFREDWLHSSSIPSKALFHIVDDIPATAMLIRTPVIKQTGPFDPIFGSYYEDFDLCMRVRRTGYNLSICSQSIIFHYSGSISQSPGARKRRSRWVIRNKTIHKIRNEPGSRLFSTCKHLVWGGLLQILRSILGTPSSSPIWSAILAYLDLIKVMPRLLSREIDKKEWHQFLQQIEWESFAAPPHVLNENFTR